MLRHAKTSKRQLTRYRDANNSVWHYRFTCYCFSHPRRSRTILHIASLRCGLQQRFCHSWGAIFPFRDGERGRGCRLAKPDGYQFARPDSEQALQEGLGTCPGVKAGQILISGGGHRLVVAWTMLDPRHWTIEKDTVLAEIQREDARMAREQAEQDRLKSEALARKVAVDAGEQRERAALADCGSSPSISGGPWFSSTYKTGVQHEIEEAMHGMFPSFFCVKSVEYLGPAPNPFGGNAARARFTGHDCGISL